MRINSNILSLSAQRTLAQTTKAIARSMERLASGRRVNSARDDAAGLAIGTGLEAQRRGMVQAIRNINDARGFLETADGAMAVQADLVQRMRELALQASNGTLSTNDRTYLDTEFQSLLSEFDRIAYQTEFNGNSLLDGAFGSRTIQVGTQKNQSLSFNLSPTTAENLLTATSAVIVGTGTFQSRMTLSTEALPEDILAIDVNNDGDIDLIAGSGSTDRLNIFIGNGNGTFEARTSQIAASPATATVRLLTSDDFNGDGNIDIAAADYDNGYVSLLFGNGNGTFSFTTTLGVSVGFYSVVAGDLDNDSDIDLVTAEFLAGNFSTFLGNGNGTFDARVTHGSGTFPSYSLMVDDLNEDGNLDLITQNLSSRTVSYLLGNGNGTFQTRRTLATGLDPYGMTTADLNGDGYQDIVSAANGDANVRVYLGNGNGTFQSSTTWATGTGPFHVQAADLNGDGNIDLVTADSTNSTVSILIGNGNGSFQARITLATGGSAQRISIADLNGDGVNDLVNTNRSDGTLSVFIGNSTTQTMTSAPSIATQTAAEDSLETLDSAMASLNSARAQIGAVQNRLSYAEASTSTLVESVSGAQSQIMATDYAEEMAEFTRLQVLQAAGLSVLAQANASINLSLELLRRLI